MSFYCLGSWTDAFFLHTFEHFHSWNRCFVSPEAFGPKLSQTDSSLHFFASFIMAFQFFFFTANKQFVFCSKTYILLIFTTFLWRLFIMLCTFILFIFFFTVLTICLCHQLPLFSLDACLNPCWSVLRWFPSLSGHSILLHWMCPMVLKCLFQIFPLF